MDIQDNVLDTEMVASNVMDDTVPDDQLSD